MSISRALPLLLLTSALGCGSGGPKGPVAPAPKASSADLHADENTWMTLAPQGARLRVPAGWKVSSNGTELRAEPGDGKAVLILDAAESKSELEKKIRMLGARYGLDRVDFQPPRAGNLNGIPVLMFEDMAAESKGAPVDVFMLLGEAPHGNGIVIVFLYASDATQKHDLELIAAANTLRPT